MNRINSMQTTALGLAKQEFVSLLSNLSPSDGKDFLDWIAEQHASLKTDVAPQEMQISASRAFQQCVQDEECLKGIIQDLRMRLPLSGICSSETMITPESGENSDCDPATTVVIDSFLYDDEDVDNLCGDNQLNRNYCKDCGSHNTCPLTFISHSMSVIQLKYIFEDVLPKLISGSSNTTLVDIGSRLGAVLYGAYYFSQFGKIIGVEMNSELCHIQNEIISKYGLGNRMQIICNDICNISEILHQADVIVLNNTFEFFLSKEAQLSTWHNMRRNICRPGCILITVPSVEQSVRLGRNQQPILDVENWLLPWNVDPVEVATEYSSKEEFFEIEKINFYKVK